MKRNYINITTAMIKEQVKKILNWKSPWPDRVQGHWLKKLTALHEHIRKQVDNISNREDIAKCTTFKGSTWFPVNKMTKGVTTNSDLLLSRHELHELRHLLKKASFCDSNTMRCCFIHIWIINDPCVSRLSTVTSSAAGMLVKQNCWFLCKR